MDSKPIPVYQNLEVHTEWVHEAEDVTLIVYLPGFKKEQIKVQLTTGGKLRISGQRPLGDNKYGRFSQEFQIPSNCDQDKIRANFRDGMLHIKHPKLIVPAEKQDEEEEKEEEEEAKPSAQVPKSDQKPAPRPPTPTPADASPKKHKNDQEQAAVQEAPPKATMEKETAEKKDGVTKQADDVSSKAPDNVKEMKDAKNATNEYDEKAKEGKVSDQNEKASTSDEKHEKLGDFFQGAAEKENTEAKILDGTNKYYQLAFNYKQVLDGLVRGLKINPKNLMNTVLVVLLVVVLAVYIRNAIWSLSLRNDNN